ncbi:hypothetical protein CPSG_03157 [Coccidioides posadasii str. Silveira]|uniref:Uncharacterized protein n=1 Tax=Coccidioides posadasii (strain RMSCC 757 / Silveira) TaxID=443226 RepID=E9D0X8_COCPS|nr:hypothetical protein CPSG_03157 [Coccidioides posadasii str. Silveira]
MKQKVGRPINLVKCTLYVVSAYLNIVIPESGNSQGKTEGDTYNDTKYEMDIYGLPESMGIYGVLRTRTSIHGIHVLLLCCFHPHYAHIKECFDLVPPKSSNVPEEKRC